MALGGCLTRNYMGDVDGVGPVKKKVKGFKSLVEVGHASTSVSHV